MMSVDVLMKEVQGMPEALIMDLVRYVRAMKSDHGLGDLDAKVDDTGEWYRKPGLLEGKIIISDDFDAPLDDFEDPFAESGSYDEKRS